jgi:hypothetical protein
VFGFYQLFGGEGRKSGLAHSFFPRTFALDNCGCRALSSL